MSRGNFHSSGTEFHVDNDGVRDDWYSAINERMDCKFSVKMLQIVLCPDQRHTKEPVDTHSVSGIIGMDCDCGVAQHSFGTSGGNDDLFVCEGV